MEGSLFAEAVRDIRMLGVHRSASLQVIFGSSVMMIMGVSLVYPVLPVIEEALKIGKGQIGLVLTAFTVPAIFFSPLGGLLIDLRGRKQVLVVSLLLYGVSGSAIVFVDSLPLLLITRFLQGVAYAGIMPLVVVLIGDTFSKEQETTAQGVKVLLDRTALLFIPAAAGGLAAIAWQLPFALYAMAIPLGLAAWRWLPEQPITKRGHAVTYVKEVFQLSMRVRSITMFSMSSMRFFLEMSFFIYVPLYAIDRLDVQVSSGGLLFTVFAIGSITTAGMVGAIARRFERVPIVIVAFALQGICLAVASVSRDIWTMGGVMLVFGLANGIISPAQKSLLTQSVASPLRGGFVASDRIWQNTAKSIAPLVAGTLVMATSIETMFQVMAGLAFGWAFMVTVLHLRGALRVELS
jgi:ACDE family multidrug resistance protein